MKEWDIVMLTEKQYLDEKTDDINFQNVLHEQQLVQTALESLDLKVTRIAWDDPEFDWSSTRVILIREIWDYFHRYLEFSKWLDTVTPHTNLINPASMIRWNLDKHYLKDLENRGINVCPSRFIEVGEQTSLTELQEQEGLDEFVIKPTVSGAARHTYRLNQDTFVKYESIFQKLIAKESMIIQPFQNNILSKGEVAYMIFGGKFSHAILKIAKEGDFRVQDDFGGTVQIYHPSDEEIAFTELVVTKTESLPVYARVDVIWDNNDDLAVAELELIEPELWFRFKDAAAAAYANAVMSALLKY